MNSSVRANAGGSEGKQLPKVNKYSLRRVKPAALTRNLKAQDARERLVRLTVQRAVREGGKLGAAEFGAADRAGAAAAVAAKVRRLLSEILDEMDKKKQYAPRPAQVDPTLRIMEQKVRLLEEEHLNMDMLTLKVRRFCLPPRKNTGDIILSANVQNQLRAQEQRASEEKRPRTLWTTPGKQPITIQEFAALLAWEPIEFRSCSISYWILKWLWRGHVAEAEARAELVAKLQVEYQCGRAELENSPRCHYPMNL